MISSSTLQAKKLASPPLFSPNAEQSYEVYREETGSSITTVSEKITPTKPKAKKKRAATGSKGNVKWTDKGRAIRLLGSLETIYNFRCPDLFRSRHHVLLLTVAGSLLAVVAEEDKREFKLADLQRWARKRVGGATRAEILDAFEAASRVHRGIPSAQDIGFALELCKFHWLRAGRPWGVHPADMTEEEVKKVQEDAKREKKRLKAAAKRKAEGALPREFSITAIAEKLGISRPTLYKRMAAAGFGKDAAAFYAFVHSTYKDKKHRGHETVNRSSSKPSARGLKAAAQSAPPKKPRADDKVRKADKRRALPGPAQPLPAREPTAPTPIRPQGSCAQQRQDGSARYTVQGGGPRASRATWRPSYQSQRRCSPMARVAAPRPRGHGQHPPFGHGSFPAPPAPCGAPPRTF